MKLTKLIVLLTLTISLLTVYKVSSQNYHQIKINDASASGQAVIYSLYGSSYEAFDTVYFSHGSVTFILPDTTYCGMYCIYYNSKNYVDIIYNHENIEINVTAPDEYIVAESEENRIFYAYNKIAGPINDTLTDIKEQGRILYAISNKTITPEIDSMRKKAMLLNKQLLNFSDSIIKSSKGLFVATYIKAQLTPDYYSYLKSPGAFPYKTQEDFLKDHYFDNIDLKENCLLNTDILFDKCTGYFNTFGEMSDHNTYKWIVDSTLNKLSGNEKFYEYALTLLLNTFRGSAYEDVYIHIVDEYILKNSCVFYEDYSEYISRAETAKKLMSGNIAPDIKYPDINGDTVSIHNIKAKVILVLFWAVDCPHCHQAIPEIVSLYDKYKNRGFEVFAVAFADNEESWRNLVIKYKMSWTNISDLKGDKSEFMKTYNTWNTPNYFLINGEMKIISHPYTTDQIREELIKNIN